MWKRGGRESIWSERLIQKKGPDGATSRKYP